MSRSKSSLARSVSTTETVAAPDTASPTPVKLTTDLTQVDTMPSPALDLQHNLRRAWTVPAAESQSAAERKIPVGWALTAVLLGCGVFWAAVAFAVFRA
jgi:hypothetical protein